MALRQVIELVDDLDGEVLDDGVGETVLFGLDGVDYEIDLSGDNAAKLRKALTQYADAGRKQNGERRRAQRPFHASKETPVDSRAVREWAAANGIEVSDRGRVPAGVIAQFRAAGN